MFFLRSVRRTESDIVTSVVPFEKLLSMCGCVRSQWLYSGLKRAYLLWALPKALNKLVASL